MLMLAAVLSASLSARGDEFEMLRLKWRNALTQGTNSSLSDPLYATWINSVGSSALSYSKSLNTNANRTCLWNSYANLATDSSDISGSFTRLRAMALGYAVHGSSLEGDTSLRAAIIGGLDWMFANYYNPTGTVYDNWFDFEIAAPLALNDTVVLLYSNLAPAQINNYMSAVEHFSPTPSYSVISSNLTAANKVWKSVVVGVRGAIVQDSNKLDLARVALSDVFPYVTTNDGFYADGSFIFHNYFPYNAGYGVELLDSMGQLMQWLQGSTWQIVDPAQSNVFRWVYDSYEPFLVRGAAMEMVDGRYHTRDGDDHERGHDVLGAILRIAQLASPGDASAMKSFVKGQIQADKFRNFIVNQPPPYNVWANAAANDSNIVAAVEATQHRQFPGMDRVVHRAPNWTFGLSMSSSRAANYESTRGENLHGWFTGDGMTYLYDSDLSQYADNFWSTVNPLRMPGTTIENYTRADGSGDSYRSPNNQTGGASILGLYGVAAMHLNSWGSTLSARKSWFMFDNEIVCVGNSVSGGTNGAAETIIENRRLGLYGNNAFTVNGVSKPASPGWSETMPTTSWAHLAGTMPGADIGYYFPQATTIKALRESRSGAMKDINTTYGSSTRSTRHYLTMYFDHGTNPSSGTYSYVLLPGLSSSAVAAYAANPDVSVVQNSSIATAVKENKLGITAINFWRDGSNYVSTVSSDHKASVIFRNDGSILDIGVSDPTQTNTIGINVELAATASSILSADVGVSVLQMTPTIKLWVNTSNKFGATLHAKLAVVPVQTNTLFPVADAYVQNGAQSVTNFGDASTLAVKLGTTSQSRDAYLRFDLSSIPGTILGATLRVVPTTIEDSLYHAIALVTNNTWIESGAGGVTWSNKPASELEYARWLLALTGTNQPISIPVTSLAQQAAGRDGKLSFRIYSTGTPTPVNGGFTAYGSKENNTSTKRPQLSITFIRLPPTIALSASSDCIDAPGTVTLTAGAQDSDGSVASVAFYNGSTFLTQSFAPPYNVTVPNLAPGTYTFSAIATDNSGLTATSGPVSVSVYAPEPVGRGTGLNAEYYSDQNLTFLFQTRTDTNINFFWGSSSPIAGIPPDSFSVRWTGKLQARHAGVHQFHADTDEGVRLWINGRLLVDDWTPHLEKEDTGSISLVPGRYYDITMEYYDYSFSPTAVARLYWTQPGIAKEIIPPSQLYPADQGLRGAYYSGTNFNIPLLTRVDSTVNFNWGTNSPDPTTLPGAYSARWTGKVKANQPGTYSFFTLSDDAVRLWVNGQLIISNWASHTATEDSGTINLGTAGQYYDVTMEYFNASGAGTAVLMWQPPGELKQVIPSSNLTPHLNNNPPVLLPIPNLSATRNAPMTFNAGATDADGTGQSLIYSIDAGAPVGATINPSSGVFSWTPSNTEPLGPHEITLRVTDTGTPQMTDAQTFSISVFTTPQLNFVRSGNNSFLTWPDSGNTFHLYTATNLAPPVTWIPVNINPVFSNGVWAVQLPAPTNTTQFFHLQNP